MSLLFIGDIAVPAASQIDFDAVRATIGCHRIVGNLEGPLFTDSIPAPLNKYKYNLYNTSGVLSFLQSLRQPVVSLANNHISDFGPAAFHTTKKTLHENSIDYFGTEDIPLLFLEEDGQSYIIIGCCTYNTDPGKGANIFKPAVLLKEISRLTKEYANHKIIVYAHWGIELLPYPLPADREWALQAIDAGAFAIIGHHPHVPQSIEVYRDRLIIYSLGNYLLPQIYFLDKKLVYKSELAQRQLSVELKNCDFHINLFAFTGNRFEDAVRLSFDDIVQSEFYALFAGLSAADYLIWFDKHAGYKNKFEKLLPTYKTYAAYMGCNSQVLKLKMNLYQSIRNISIRSKIHNPYKH